MQFILTAKKLINSSIWRAKKYFKSKQRKIRPTFPRRKAASVFVTGDAGWLGTSVCKKLANYYNIIGFDRAVDKNESLDNISLMTKKMKGARYVVHLAAIPHPRMGSFNDYFRVNVLGTLNVLTVAKKNKIKRFIYLSSTAYYGCDIIGKLFPLYFPIDEKHPIASTPEISKGGLNEYDQSKVMAEQICAYFGTNGLIEVVVLRSAPANDNQDQYPEGFEWKKCTGYQRGSFWANNPPENVARAVILALKSKKCFKYQVYNVANKYTDRKVNVEKFVKREYPKVKIKVKLKNNPSLVDTRKIQQELGFRAIDYKKK